MEVVGEKAWVCGFYKKKLATIIYSSVKANLSLEFSMRINA